MAIRPSNYGASCTTSVLRANVHEYGWETSTSNAVKEGFEQDANYRIVYKNMNYSKTYKTWIYEGNASEKTVGYLHLLSYPYNTVQFAIGDYIQFDYNENKDKPENYKFWILQSLDQRHLYEVHGRMLPCNQRLRWQAGDGTVYDYPCYFNTEMTKTNILDSGQGFNVESGAIIAIVQQNSYTSTIYVNQRFILNGRSYVCYQYNDNIDPGLIYIYLRLTAEQLEDNFEDSLAYNGEPVTGDVSVSGDVCNVTSTETLPVGEQINIIINNYNNGVATGDTFTATTYNVPSSCYDLTTVSGNSFMLTNLKQYTKNPLRITLENERTGNTTVLYVWLGGAL